MQYNAVRRHSKTESCMILRATALSLLEIPLATRFIIFCLRKRLMLNDMDRYSWEFCRGYEASRLDLRMR